MGSKQNKVKTAKPTFLLPPTHPPYKELSEINRISNIKKRNEKINRCDILSHSGDTIR
jgi:hypothetical protein